MWVGLVVGSFSLYNLLGIKCEKKIVHLFFFPYCSLCDWYLDISIISLWSANYFLLILFLGSYWPQPLRGSIHHQKLVMGSDYHKFRARVHHLTSPYSLLVSSFTWSHVLTEPANIISYNYHLQLKHGTVTGYNHCLLQTQTLKSQTWFSIPSQNHG